MQQHNNLNKRLGDLTVGEFLSLIENRPATPPPTPGTQEIQIRKVPLKRLAALYGWGHSTIYRWIDTKYIPHHRVGGDYWFDLDEIEKWIADKKVRCKDELLKDFSKGKKFFSKT